MKYETCPTCVGAGLVINTHTGEPTECYECSGNSVVPARDKKGRWVSMMNEVAIQYPTFQDFYLKARKDAYEAELRLRGHEVPYGVVRKVFEKHALLNEIIFTLGRDIDIKITLRQADRLQDIDIIAWQVGAALVAAGLRDSPEYSELEGGFNPWKTWQWWMGGYYVFIEASIPLEGTADYMVVPIPETVASTRYKLVRRTEQTEDQGARRTAA